MTIERTSSDMHQSLEGRKNIKNQKAYELANIDGR